MAEELWNYINQSSKFNESIHCFKLPSRTTDRSIFYQQYDVICLCLPKLLQITAVATVMNTWLRVPETPIWNCLVSSYISINYVLLGIWLGQNKRKKPDQHLYNHTNNLTSTHSMYWINAVYFLLIIQQFWPTAILSCACNRLHHASALLFSANVLSSLN